jgi:cystathionine beta-lyase
MHLSNMIIPNEKLRRTFNNYMSDTGVAGGHNPLALTAIEAAYNHGEPWLEQVLDYIWGNYQTLKSFIEQNLPQLKVTELQGTYLCWVDFRELGLAQEQLEKLTQLDARVLLDEGHIFGQEGLGFERFNLACPRPLVILALERLKTEIEKL